MLFQLGSEVPLEPHLNWKLKSFVHRKKRNTEHLHNRLETDTKLEFTLNVNKVSFTLLKGDVLEVTGSVKM